MRFAVAALCLLALSFQGMAERAEPFKPTVPQLELKQADGKWRLFQGDKHAPQDKALIALLKDYAAHKDEAAGWPGIGKDSISDNPLVVHLDAHTPWAHAWPLVEAMVEAKLPKLVLGTTQHITTKLDTAKAPDTARLGEGFLFTELPRDEGLSNSVPREWLSLELRHQTVGKEKNGKVEFLVGKFARKRDIIEGSAHLPAELVLQAEAREEERQATKARRAELITMLATAIEAQIAASGTNITVAKLTESPAESMVANPDKSAPWVFAEVGALALAKVNAKRVSDGKEALRIEMPWQQWPVPEPPAPAPDTLPEEPQPEPEPEPGRPSEPFPPLPGDHDEPSPPAKSGDAGDEIGEDPADEPDKGEGPDPFPDPSTEVKPEKSGPAVGWSGGYGTPRLPKTPRAWVHRRSLAPRDNWKSISGALKWLADHQDREGFWSATNFPAASTRKEAATTGNIEFVKPGEKGADFGWEAVTDIGLTGLSLLAFTANGLDHKYGDYRSTVRNAIIYLRKVQDNDGCFGPKDEDQFVYNHAIAATALAETYGLSSDPVLKLVVEKSVEFILSAQNPGLGWRYGVKPAQTDSSVTGWMLLALHSAKEAGIAVDTTKVHEGAFKWLDTVTVQDGDKRWRTGYDSPGSNNARLRSAAEYDNNPTMDGIHGAVRILAAKTEGADAKLADFEKSITENPPKWEHKKLDYYYWFWAAMFMQQRSGKARDAWWESAAEVLTKHQRGWHELDTKAERTTAAKLAEHGSWDAVDAWSMAGGRVYATAMGALTLSMPWRFAPPAGKATPEQPKAPEEK